MSAAEIFDAFAFLHVVRAGLSQGRMTQSDSFWFVRLHKCLHLTSALEGPLAFVLTVFLNGV